MIDFMIIFLQKNRKIITPAQTVQVCAGVGFACIIYDR
jgi:hypothetical protein